MAQANSEQLTAIEHSGGVLLKAGAGSGKTFVLKEHMIYLCRKWINEYREAQPLIDFSDLIKNKLSKIVLMTFTKKAAGEISIRLNTEFEEIFEQSSPELKPYWENVCANLDYLTVTTIHGFCFKLIKQGFFPEVDIDNEVLSDSQYNDLIENIFEQWISENLASESEEEFIDIILKDKDFVLSSLKSIMSDPTLRMMWDKIDSKKLKISEEQTIEDILDLFKLKNSFENKGVISIYSEYEGKKWYDFLNLFFSKFDRLSNLDELLEINSYLKELKYKIPTSPRSNSTELEIYNLYQELKALNAFCKNSGDDIDLYSKNYENFVLPWFEKFKKLVEYTSFLYDKSPGITFSDLEYIVRVGLENEDIAEKVSESFDYLIVDEFQDTSYVQFEIIQKIIHKDFKKLFCVGDIKQAIYGFRGGELGVFLDCEKMTNRVLSLKNNYRSDKEIVNFNNNFFDFLFKKGLKFSGEDFKPVEVEYQENPIDERALGEIYEIESNIDFVSDFGIDKVGNSEVEYLEALLLLEKIKELKKNEEKSCILYKKLKPSLLLIGLMIENDIGFTAQIKIPFSEDPICALFKLLIEKKFNSSINNNEYLNLMIKGYFALLDASINIDAQSLINQFEIDRDYFGLYQAYYNFLAGANLANSNYKNNLIQIKTLCDIANEDDQYLVSLLDKSADISYSLDFQYGKDATAVTIMTAHASKGLQFSNVLLGGIYTNDKSFPFTGLFGKYPLSMKWSSDITSKKKYKTPQYILESEITKLKDFSESKRLFYVAATRAVNTLGWVNIDFGKIKKRTNSNSWHNGISVWKNEIFKSNIDIIKLIKKYEYNIRSNFDIRFLENASNKKPLFHIDTLGTTTKLSDTYSQVLPELSVTRLASIVDCPRKFYLQNICKITENDISLVGGELQTKLYEEDDELSSKTFSSSAQRGTKLHSDLEEVIKNQLNYPEHFTQKEKSNIDWAVDKLRKYPDNFNFLAEQSLKFKLFNYMISGIPDLYIIDQNNQEPAEIWDFKTGAIKEENNEIYQFQLIAYAYALFELNIIPIESRVKISLMFLDEKKQIEKEYDFQSVENYLRSYWSDIKTPSKINTNHCDSCPYGNICHK